MRAIASRSRSLSIRVALVLAFGLAAVSTLHAAEPASTSGAEPLPSLWRNLKLDIAAGVRVPTQMSARRWRTLGLGLAAIGASAAFDESLRERMLRGQTASNMNLARRIRPLGEAGGIALLGLGWGVGAARHDREWVATAQDGLEATFFAAGLLAPILKEASGRARPNTGQGRDHFRPFSGDFSFPSGEATEAFAIASVLSAHTTHPWLRVAAYATAAVVAEGRLRLDEHWLSDVMAGGLLGTAVGTWVVHEHQRRAAEPAAELAPDGLRWTGGPTFNVSRDGRRRLGLGFVIAW